MTPVKSPSRRYADFKWHFRLAGMAAVGILASSIFFLSGRVQELQGLHPHNPHFSQDHCFDCHEQHDKKKKRMGPEECFKCHDLLSRALLPNAKADMLKNNESSCVHPTRGTDPKVGSVPTLLCGGCHAPGGYVALYDISKKLYVEVDMAATHPVGLRPTATVYPRTLPLSHSGTIDCITCHDQHANDRRLRMLRLYYPGNGHPADFRPLCNDCHLDGWAPLTVNPRSAVRQSQGHHE